MAHRRDKRNGGGGSHSQAHLLDPKVVDGRAPPHDLDAEAAVIAAVMLDEPRLSDVAWLRSEHFYAERHRLIWEAILYLRAAGIKIDVVTVATRLKDTDRIAQVGGFADMTMLLNSAPTTAHVDTHARIVADKAQVRRLIATCQVFAARGYLEGDRRLVAEAELAVTELAHTTSGSVQFIEAEEIFAPIPAEEPWLCKAMRLLHGRINLIAGDPESGKSLVAQAIALCVAADKPIFGVHMLQRSGPVVWANWDQPDVRTVRKRFVRLARVLDIDPALIRGRIRIAHKPRLYLSDPAHLLELRAIMRDHVLFVGDALTGFARGVDENSPEIGDRLRDFSEQSELTSCVSLLIHHARKNSPGFIKGKQSDKEADEDASSIRGSNSIIGACGTVFKMREISKRDGTYRVSQVRNATTSLRKLDTFAVRFVDVCERDDGGGDPHWGVRVDYVDPDELAAMKKTAKDAEQKTKPDRAEVLEQIKARIVELVKKQPGLDSTDLYELVPSMRKSTFNAAMKLLESHTDPAHAMIRDAKGGRIGDKKPKEWWAT